MVWTHRSLWLFTLGTPEDDRQECCSLAKWPRRSVGRKEVGMCSSTSRELSRCCNVNCWKPFVNYLWRQQIDTLSRALSHGIYWFLFKMNISKPTFPKLRSLTNEDNCLQCSCSSTYVAIQSIFVCHPNYTPRHVGWLLGCQFRTRL